jgi:hypothetical protein
VGGDQLGGDEHGCVVDGHRRVEGATADRREPCRRGDLPGRVVGEPGGEVQADRVRAAGRDDGRDPIAEVVEHLVPRGGRAAEPRAVEPVGPVVPRGESTALGADVAA